MLPPPLAGHDVDNGGGGVMMVHSSTPPLDPDLSVVRRKCGFPGASVLSGGCAGGLSSLRSRRRDCYLVCSVLSLPEFWCGLLCRGIWIRFWVSCGLMRLYLLRISFSNHIRCCRGGQSQKRSQSVVVAVVVIGPILFSKVVRAQMGVIHIHFAGPSTLGCDSDCGARKGDGFVIVAYFRLIRGRKLVAVFVALSGVYMKLGCFRVGGQFHLLVLLQMNDLCYCS